MEILLTTSPEKAAAIIRNGGIVAFPTETVYGLGANVFDPEAIARIFTAKTRPADNPLIAHVSTIDQIKELATEIPESARLFIQEFFPGPLTLVLKKADPVPYAATASLDTIGVRMPRNTLARDFLLSCGTPVVAPSANLSGRPSPTTWQAVYEDLKGRIDCILQGEPTEIGLESTVVDCTADQPTVLRLGAVTIAQLCEIVQETRSNTEFEVEKPKSPGVKHRHYSPDALVVIVSEIYSIPFLKNSAFVGIHDPKIQFDKKLIVESVDEYARGIFEFFRECDRSGIETIFCESVVDFGLGSALMDRLRRAVER